MPSIQDVADEINAKLDQINQNTASTVTKIETLDGHVQAGVAQLSAGLFAIWELQKVTNSILEHHSRQNDTVICLLENTNELLCGITRKLTRQLDVGERQLTSLRRVEGIAERVHGAAAGDYDRAAELEAKILECCPPEEPEPEPCPDPCEVPKHRPYRPKGQDWQPEEQPAPIG
jgi:hypothetical protein